MSGREAAASEGSEAPKQAGAGLQATSLPWAFLHLAVLTAFALGQPLFDLLGKNPEFFAARGSSAGDIVTFALLVVVGPPLIGVADRVPGRPGLQARAPGRAPGVHRAADRAGRDPVPQGLVQQRRWC